MKNKVQDIPSSMHITNISNGLEQLNDLSKTQQGGGGGVTAQGIKTISGHIVQQPHQPPPPLPSVISVVSSGGGNTGYNDNDKNCLQGNFHLPNFIYNSNGISY